MLFHHDARGYEVAASEAATHARGIMEAKIDAGRASAAAIFERIHREVPDDRIIRSEALRFSPVAAPAPGGSAGAVGLVVGARNEHETYGIHRHALSQMAGKAGVPGAYLAELAGSAEDWKRDLAADILGRHFGHTNARFLTRAVGGEVRGFLSDRFRRLDSRPLLETFATACNTVGAVPVDGTGSDTRVTMKAFLPIVFEPVPNEVLCLGIEWGNSDYGAARHTVRAMIWRLWCTNKATMEDSLAQVHLGGRLADDIEFSNRTYELDTQASVSALKDVVMGVLGPAKVNALLGAIRSAHEKQIDWAHLRTALSRKLLKGELAEVEAAYKSDDVVMLPPGNTAWRASNAISWIAGRIEDADRRLELERVAGEVVNGKRDRASDPS